MTHSHVCLGRQDKGVPFRAYLIRRVRSCLRTGPGAAGPMAPQRPARARRHTGRRRRDCPGRPASARPQLLPPTRLQARVLRRPGCRSLPDWPTRSGELPRPASLRAHRRGEPGGPAAVRRCVAARRRSSRFSCRRLQRRLHRACHGAPSPAAPVAAASTARAAPPALPVRLFVVLPMLPSMGPPPACPGPISPAEYRILDCAICMSAWWSCGARAM